MNELPKWRVDNLWSFIVSIVVSVFAFAALYFGLKTDLGDIKKDIAFQTQLLQEHRLEGEKDITAIVTSLNEAHRRLALLEGKLGDSSGSLK